MEKKNMVFLSVIAVATLLTAVVGTTFSFFTATVDPDDGKDYQNTTITTINDLAVVYAQNDKIALENAIPGAEASYTLSVTNNSATVNVDFNLVWKNVTNGFAGSASAGDITYKIESCTDSTCTSPAPTVIQDTTALPTTAGAIDGATNLTVNAGQTNYYRVTVTFAKTDKNQNDLMGKSFTGQVQVGAAAQSGTDLSKVTTD